MQRRMVTIVIVILTMLGVTMFVNGNSNNASADAIAFTPRPLTTATPGEIVTAAIAYTRAYRANAGGMPAAPLVRPITKTDLPALGLGTFDFLAPEQPLVLVILKGDFDMSYFPHGGAGGNAKAQYLAHVFDLKSGAPMITISSPHGGVFRLALNDPTLPDDTPTP